MVADCDEPHSLMQLRKGPSGTTPVKFPASKLQVSGVQIAPLCRASRDTGTACNLGIECSLLPTVAGIVTAIPASGRAARNLPIACL